MHHGRRRVPGVRGLGRQIREIADCDIPVT
jgi:hypothetical protein